MQLLDGSREEYETIRGKGAASAHVVMPPAVAVGDKLLSRGREVTLLSVLPSNGCVVQFGEGDVTNDESYDSMFGNEAGSARLSRCPASLAPDERVEYANAVSKSTRVRVCLRPPCQCHFLRPLATPYDPLRPRTTPYDPL